MKKLLIIDGLNMFLRSYIVIPSLDPKGNPIGGTIGFLKSLQKVCRDFSPDEVIVCWDGEGGSEKRRLINKNYKAGRKPPRFNRRMYELSPEQQEMNKTYQLIRLMEYLNELPIIQLRLKYVEADDIISEVAQHHVYAEWHKIIVSSDKDFFQLCRQDISVYRPIQNTTITDQMILEEHGVHPNNFALARALVGDKSDNLKGINRIGMKTVKNRLPFMKEEKTYEVKDVIKFSREQRNKLACYRDIVKGEETIKTNYDIMQLYSPNISSLAKKSINFALTEFEPLFNKIEVLKMLLEDGQASYNFDNLWLHMKKIKK